MISLQGYNPLVNLIKYIIGTYFLKINGIMVIYNSSNLTPNKDDCLSGISQTLANNTLPKAFSSFWINVANLSDEEFFDIMLRDADLGAQGYIVLLEDTDKFVSTKYEVTQRSVVRQMDRNILIVSEEEDPQRVLINPTLRFYPIHLYAAIKDNGQVEFWTQKSVGITNFNSPMLLDVFYFASETFKMNANLYPDKLENLMGLPVNVSVTICVPFVVVINVEPGKGNVDAIGRDDKSISFFGIEAAILRNFCVIRNCSLKIASFGVDGWGKVYKTGYSTGSIGALYKKQVDVSVGSHYKGYYGYFDKSHSITQVAVTLLTPRPGPYPVYLTLSLPFDNEVWICVLVTIFVCTCGYFLVKMKLISWALVPKENHQSFTFTCLEVIIIFVQQSYSQERFKTFSVRLCLATFLLCGIIIDNSYSGALKSLLTVPKLLNPINTGRKFVNSDLKWAGTTELLTHTIRNSHDDYDLKILKKFELRSADELRNISLHSRAYALPIRKLQKGSYTYGNYVRYDALEKFIMLRQKLYYEFTYIYSLKGWPLISKVNSIIFRITEHGILDALESGSVARHMNRQTQQGLRRLATTSRTFKSLPKTLNLNHVSGSLVILLAGYVTATLVFICELKFKFMRLNHN